MVVNEMLDQKDSVFKNKLINVFLQSPNSSQLIKIQNVIDDFQDNLDGYAIDVFYLEDIIKEAEPLAEKVCSLLRSKYSKYTIRKRLLPKTINARKGYRIDCNQIRYDIGSDEEKLARGILNEIQEDSIFKKEQPILKGINQNTKNYMSIFVRNM